MRIRTRAGLMVLALMIGSAGAARPAAQGSPQEAPPPSSPGAGTPQQGEPTARRGASGARGPRGRDVITLGLRASAGTNGRQDLPPDGLSVPLVDARVVSDFSTRLTFRPVVSPMSWQLTGEMSYRGYDNREFMAMGRSVGTGATWGVGSRTRMSVSGSASYLPIYSLVLPMVSTSEALAQLALAQVTAAATGTPIVPTAPIDYLSGALPSSALDFGVAKTPAYSGNVGFSVMQNLTSRVSASGSAQMGGTDFKAERNHDSKDWGASGRVSYAIVNGIGVHAGYGRRVVAYYSATGLDDVVLDDLDLGLDITKGFSLNRRRKGFTLGAGPGSVISTDGKRRQFRATGSLDLSKELGRYANLSVGYHRGAYLQPGFLRPVFSDAVVAGASGRIARAATWNLSYSRWFGRVDPVDGIVGDGRAYHTSTGSARVSFPLTQRSGLYIQYMAYQHDMDQSLDVVGVLTRHEIRQTGRIGFSLDLPLLRDTSPRGEKGRNPCFLDVNTPPRTSGTWSASGSG